VSRRIRPVDEEAYAKLLAQAPELEGLISGVRLGVLLAIHELGAATAAQIAALSGIGRTSVYWTIDVLEADGFIFADPPYKQRRSRDTQWRLSQDKLRKSSAALAELCD
jgi:DNA-binding MarR family transcriptional regulator